LINSIHSITVAVADQDKALDFYVNTLGWEKAMDSPMVPNMRWVTVAPPGAATQLALGHESWFSGEHAAARPGRVGISVIAPDIDATYATLVARGVKFKGPVEPMPWGAKATWFYDLDGNEFFLVNE